MDSWVNSTSPPQLGRRPLTRSEGSPSSPQSAHSHSPHPIPAGLSGQCEGGPRGTRSDLSPTVVLVLHQLHGAEFGHDQDVDAKPPPNLFGHAESHIPRRIRHHDRESGALGTVTHAA